MYQISHEQTSCVLNHFEISALIKKVKIMSIYTSCKFQGVICILISSSNSLVIIFAGLPSARLCTTSGCNFGSSAATYFSSSSNLLRKLLLSQQGKYFSKSALARVVLSFLFDVTEIQLYHGFFLCLVFFFWVGGGSEVDTLEEMSIVVVIWSNYD